MAEICKKRNIPLIVDEAHGSLWNYSDELPVCARLNLGQMPLYIHCIKQAEL